MHSTTTLLLLTSPLVLALSFPPRAGYCTTVNQFTIPNIEYSSQITYSTPAHLAVSSAEIKFNVSSSVAPEAACSGRAGGQQDAAGFFAFPQTFNCAEPAGGASKSTFQYLGYSKQLQINETWSCGGSEYLATATTNLDLKCEESVYNNPSWTIGQIYSSRTVACEPLSVTLTPEVTKLE